MAFTCAPKLSASLSPKKSLVVREHIVQERPRQPPKKKSVSRPVKKKPRKRKAAKKVAKPKPKKKSRDLIAELDASLAKIEKQSSQIAFHQSTSIPTQVKIQSSRQTVPNAQAKLTAFLSDHLELPEIGDVTLTFTVQPNGKIARIKAISSHSNVNEKYLLESLRGLIFPNLGSEEVEFTVTFCGEG